MSRRGAGLSALSLLAGLLAAGAVSAGAVAAAVPAAAASSPGSGHVVVIGVPGLRWDDLGARRTPALWALAAHGALGSLSIRTARSVTCPPDGWVSLGAGNRARAPRPAGTSGCPDERGLPAVRPHGDGARVDLEPVKHSNRPLEFGTEVGALGTALHRAHRCVAAVGPGAAVAAADGHGRVDRYAASVAQLDPVLLRACPLSVVALDELVHAPRRVAVGRVDAEVARLRAAAPTGATLIVAGISELGDEPSHLHVAIADGPGFRHGWLSSPSTRKPPFVQLIDLAPTVLQVLGVREPAAMAGQPATGGHPGRPAGEASARSRLVDADVAAQEQRDMVPQFFSILVGAQVVLYLGCAWALRRRQELRPRRRVLTVTRVLAVAFMSAPVATYTANLWPWWRGGHPLVELLLAVGAGVFVFTALAYVGPWRRALLGPAAVVAALTAGILAVDIGTGSRLQMSSLAGYSPLVAGRFSGFGNVAYAVFATGALLLAACLAAHRRRRTQTLIVTAIGVSAVVCDGSPLWGSDFGGVIALVPAFAVLGLMVTGRRISVPRLAGMALAAIAAVSLFAYLDYLRPVADQTHLGRFVGQLIDGTGWTVIRRKADSNLHLLTHSVLTLLVPIAVIFLAAVLLRPTGGLRRAFERAPAFRAGLIGVLVMGVVGFLANDSGVAIPALAMTVAIPAAIAVSVGALATDARDTIATTVSTGSDAPAAC